MRAMSKSPIADPNGSLPVPGGGGGRRRRPGLRTVRCGGRWLIRPYGYGAIWERIQADIDRRIKAAGADNVYFPLFIPESYLQPLRGRARRGLPVPSSRW